MRTLLFSYKKHRHPHYKDIGVGKNLRFSLCFFSVFFEVVEQKWCIGSRIQRKSPSNRSYSPILQQFLLLALHGGEQQNVADCLTVGQQHGHAVDAEADAARGGHTQLEGTPAAA